MDTREVNHINKTVQELQHCEETGIFMRLVVCKAIKFNRF